MRLRMPPASGEADAAPGGIFPFSLTLPGRPGTLPAFPSCDIGARFSCQHRNHFLRGEDTAPVRRPSSAKASQKAWRVFADHRTGADIFPRTTIALAGLRIPGYPQIMAAAAVRAFLAAHPCEKTLLAAVSGGIDSVVLLHALHETATGHRIVVCHLNHGLRGRDSDEDAAFVRELAARLSLPFMEGSSDVRAQAEQDGLSLETAGRHQRHRFFAACARRYRSRTVFLAHHADDQVETILANLLRGSGGLRGMEPITSLLPEGSRKPLTLCRPLLGITRSAISAWAASHALAFREDATNAIPDAFRNRLRLEAIPALLKAAGRDFRPALLRAAAMASEDTGFLRSLAIPIASRPQLPVPELLNLPPALRRHVLHQWLQHHQIPDCGSREVAAVASLLDPSLPPRVNLPASHQAGRTARQLWIRRLS